MKKTLKSAGAIGLAAATILTGLSFGPAAVAAPATDAPRVVTPFLIHGAIDNTYYGIKADGTLLVQKSVLPTEPLMQLVWPNADRVGPISSLDGKLCLTVPSASHHAPVSLQPCDASNDLQAWAPQASGEIKLAVDHRMKVDGDGQVIQLWKTDKPEFDELIGWDDALPAFHASVSDPDVHGRSAKLTGTGTPGATVVINDRDPVVINDDGEWTATLTGLTLGKQTVSLTQWEGTEKTDETTVDVDLAVSPVTVATTFPDDRTQDAVASGTAHPGATVVVQDAAGNEIDRVDASTLPSGAWSLAIPAPNASGDYGLKIHQEIDDEVNGEITATIAYGDAVTTAAPVDNAAHLGGAVAMHGRGEPGAQITVREQGHATVIGSGTALPSGTWHVNTIDLNDRKHILEVTQTGKGNNVTTSTITLNPEAGDALPLSLTTPGDNATVVAPDKQVTFTGKGTPGATIEVKASNGRSLGKAPVDAAGNWSVTGELAHDLMYELHISTTGAGTSDTLTTHVKLVAQASVIQPLSLTTPGDNATVVAPDKQVTFTGKGTTGATVEVKASNGRSLGKAPVDAAGNWSVTGELAHDLMYELHISTTGAGSSDTITTHVKLVKTESVIAPFAVDQSGELTPVALNTFQFSGTGAAGARVRLFNHWNGADTRDLFVGQEVIVKKDGTWSAQGEFVGDGRVYTLHATMTAGPDGGDAADTFIEVSGK